MMRPEELDQDPVMQQAGWVPRTGRGFPQVKVIKGWEPGGGSPAEAPVGVGADDDLNPFLTPEEERRRLQAKYGWNPAQRMQELGQQFQQNPVMGSISAIGLPFEALNAGVHYAGGAIQGLEQAGGEALAGRQIEGPDRMIDQGPFGQKLLPRVQNVLNPAEANARYDAIMNPVAQFGVDAAAGGIVGGPVMKAAGSGAGWAAPKMAAATQNVPWLQQVGQAIGPLANRTPQPLVTNAMTGFLGDVGNVLTNPLTQKGIGLGVPAAAGVSTWMQQDPNEPTEQKILNTGLATLAGAGAGQLLTAGLRTLGTGFTRSSLVFEHEGTAPVGQDPYSATEATAWGAQGKANRAAVGGVYDDVNAPKYPGGYAGLVWDSLRTEATDRFAYIESYRNMAAKESGVPLPPHADTYERLRLLNGMSDKVKEILSGVGPILEQYGVPAKALGVFNDKDAMSDFDKLRFAKLAFDRVNTVGGTNKMNTGPAVRDVAFAKQLLIDTAERTNKYYGDGTDPPITLDPVYGHPILSGTAEKWANAAFDITQKVYNRALIEAKDAGLFTQQEFMQKMLDNPTYGAFRVTEEGGGAVGIQGVSLNHMGVANSRDTGEAHSTIKGTTLRLQDDLQHTARLLTLAQQNRVGQSMEDLRTLSPTFAESVMRDTHPTSGKPVTEGMETPAGWSLLPVYRNDLTDATTGLPMEEAVKKMYLVPKMLGDSLTDMTKGQADLMTGWMAKMVQPFHLGITSLSLPFLFRNPFKDAQTLYANYGGETGPLLRNMAGAWFESIVGRDGTNLDAWVKRNQGNPLVQGLGGRIYDSLDNFLNPDGRQMANFNLSGAGSGRLLTQFQGPQDVSQAANLPGATRGGIRGALDKVPGGVAITGIPDLIMTAATIGENASRLAVFRMARSELTKAGGMASGDIDQRAAFLSRNALVDFSKGGNTLRLASVWMPLLNARLQGTLASIDAAKQDPQGFMTRSALMSALPTIATYANNRLMFGDLYDKISQDEKDKNHIIIFGSYTNDRGEALPLRLKIPKDEMSALISTPLEHFLDTKFHVESNQVPLNGDQRTERSASQMMLNRLANLLPINLNSNNSLDPGSLMMSTVAMNPLIGTITQMWANRDMWQGQPIIPDDKMMLPPQYQFDQRTPQISKALSALLHAVGAPQELQLSLAPARTAFMARGFGGTAAQQFMGAGDTLVAALNKGAEAAGYPPIDFNPKTLQDLGAPPGADPEFWQPQIDALERNDTRPWYTKAPILSTLLGGGGGAQSVMSKVQQSMSPRDQEIWNQTRAAMQQYGEAKQQIERRTQEMYASAATGELSHVQIEDRKSKLDAETRGAMVGLHAQFPLALVDAKERQAFIERIPGVPIQSALAAARAELPSGLDIDTLVARYQNPDTDPALAGLGPLARQQAKSLELQRISNQFQVPVAVLRDYIATAVAGKQLPALGVPDLALENLINEYRAPHNPKTGEPVNLSNISGENLGALRRYVITQKAQEWGIPEDQILQRVQARMASPDEQHPIAQSMERAFSVSAEIHDPQKFPQYVDRSGNALGTPDEWRYWDAIRSSAAGDWKKQKNPLVRDLQTAWDSANVRQKAFLFSNENYQDYARWFGVGRNMNPVEWEKFMTGAYPKYQDNPLPQEALRRDSFIQLWQAMPDKAPEKKQMMKTVQKYERLATKNWRSKLLLDEAQWEDANYGQLG